MAQACNPFAKKGRLAPVWDWGDFNKANPPLPYIGKELTVGDVVQAELVYQYLSKKLKALGWIDCPSEAYYKQMTEYYPDDHETRQAWLIFEAGKPYGIRDKGHMGGTPPPFLDDLLNEQDKKICGENCGCKTEHDCYGEAALNLADSLSLVSFDADEDYTIINGKKFTELEAIEIANKIMNHYYTDHD